MLVNSDDVRDHLISFKVLAYGHEHGGILKQ